MGMRDNSKILAAGMAINMPAIADPMKSEAYERERKQVEGVNKEEDANKEKFLPYVARRRQDRNI